MAQERFWAVRAAACRIVGQPRSTQRRPAPTRATGRFGTGCTRLPRRTTASGAGGPTRCSSRGRSPEPREGAASVARGEPEGAPQPPRLSPPGPRRFLPARPQGDSCRTCAGSGSTCSASIRTLGEEELLLSAEDSLSTSGSTSTPTSCLCTPDRSNSSGRRSPGSGDRVCQSNRGTRRARRRTTGCGSSADRKETPVPHRMVGRLCLTAHFEDDAPRGRPRVAALAPAHHGAPSGLGGGLLTCKRRRSQLRLRQTSHSGSPERSDGRLTVPFSAIA
jgi:hypothetical protein